MTIRATVLATVIITSVVAVYAGAKGAPLPGLNVPTQTLPARTQARPASRIFVALIPYNEILVFAGNSNGDVPPLAVISSPFFSHPSGLDVVGPNLYVTNSHEIRDRISFQHSGVTGQLEWECPRFQIYYVRANGRADRN